MTYDICGDCLHARSSHTEIDDRMVCACCGKKCDKECYNMIHRASSIIINGKQKVNLSDTKEMNKTLG